MKKSVPFILTFLLSVCYSNAQISASLFRYPDVSKTHITFVYADDIWIVPKEGGIASRLSSPDGEEVSPKFSPDGKMIAFSGNYDGILDVYTIPALGGVPQRITFHGGVTLGWQPNGEKILFASSKESGRLRFDRLFTIDKNGGLPQALPPAYAESGSFSPDGKQLAFTDKSRLNRTWKRYRGGMAPDIYVMNLDDYSTVNITNNDASDELPMWHDSKIYYLSDNGPEKRYNIWEYDTDTKTSTQRTDFSDFDVHFPSIGPDDMVFEAGGDLYLMNLNTGRYNKVNIQVITDMFATLPRTVKGEEYMQHYNISPEGNRALIETRGEIFSVPAEKGFVKNLTQSSGSAQRYPAWSPDGKTVAFWSDASGEYELTLYNIEKGTSKKITSLGPGFRYNIYWSPDSKKVVYVDQAMNINVTEIESGKTKTIDKGLWMFQGDLDNFNASWSTDSRWISWGRGAENRNSVVFIYDTRNDKKEQVTSDYYNNFSPAFDPEGKYLYVLTNRAMQPAYSDFDNTFIYDNSTLVAAISLKKDTPSPLEPENDNVGDEKQADDKANDNEEKSSSGSGDNEDTTKVKSVEIDFDGLEKRLVLLTVDAGNYRNLSAVKDKIIFHDFTNANDKNESKPVVYWDLKEREQKTIVNNADNYMLSAKNEKLLISDKQKLSIIEVKESQKVDKYVPLQEIEITVQPKEEWKQLFMDTWRFERDYFYDKNMHGLDWKAMKEKYGKLIDQAVSREDVNFVLGELIGEMNASHTYKGGGDLEKSKRRNVGYLGRRLEN